MALSHFFLREFGFYELLLYGVIIVFIIRFMPEGLISLPRLISSHLNISFMKERR
jgi:ABC-type branched-subunit amino acid transport system permease subunit